MKQLRLLPLPNAPQTLHSFPVASDIVTFNYGYLLNILESIYLDNIVIFEKIRTRRLQVNHRFSISSGSSSCISSPIQEDFRSNTTILTSIAVVLKCLMEQNNSSTSQGQVMLGIVVVKNLVWKILV
ncbi:MAG: hypothetical protein WBA93_11410 [Microcoleaceae cyanobacterium]